MPNVAPMTATAGSILIVEDHALTRCLMREWLTEQFAAIQINEADSGEAALEVAAGRHHDVVLMDVRLPGIDGIETTRRLREQHPDLRILILTNHELPHYQQAADDAGAYGFVLKRTMHRDLLPLLGRLLRAQGESQ